jgi:hypothetical protein
MLCHAAIASFTVLASQRHSNHAWNAKVLLIKLPQAQQLVNDNLLLCETTKFGDKSRLIEHRAEVEISTKSIKYSEEKIAKGIRGKCSWDGQQSISLPAGITQTRENSR